MKRGVQQVPVTAKIRLGWNDDDRNYLDQAKAAVDGGADAITVHGRTRNARYRLAADWDAIGEVVAAVPVPVVGNGDLLFPHEIDAARARSGCAAVMSARGVLIKPWLFREVSDGYLDLDGEARVAHLPPLRDAGARTLGRRRLRPDHGCGNSCAGTSGSGAATPAGAPTARGRRCSIARPPRCCRAQLEALLARTDDAALDFVTDRLLAGEPLDSRRRPGPAAAAELVEMTVEG